MRVISGTARGTKLRTSDAPHLQPMTDRVKENLFNIIRAVVGDSRVLDCFSGCGALGIEALSRGAASCVFVERDPRLVRLVRANVEKCHLSDRGTVLEADFFSLPGTAPPVGVLPAGLAFVDPPYAFVDDPNRRAELFRVTEAIVGAWIGCDAVLMLHHEPMPHALWPTRLLKCYDQRVYGRSQLTFFELSAGSEDKEG